MHALAGTRLELPAEMVGAGECDLSQFPDAKVIVEVFLHVFEDLRQISLVETFRTTVYVAAAR
jgi:hypothetical protein